MDEDDIFMFYIGQAKIFVVVRIKDIVLVLSFGNPMMLSLLQYIQDKLHLLVDIFELFLEVPGKH